MKKSVLVLNLLCASLAIQAQVSGVVMDRQTMEPVVHANVYTLQDGQFIGCMTDWQGHFTLAAKTQRYTVSHLNYQRRTFTELPDTVYLEPKENSTPEVVITGKEPAWIRPKLRQFVQLKEQNYQTRDLYRTYSYETSNIGDSTGYAFASEGTILLPSLRHLRKDSVYQVDAPKNVITYKDSTAGPDWSLLKTLLYDNFVTGMDNKFIRQHRFAFNPHYHGADGVVQIVFWSNKYDRDRGTLDLDTTRCVILAATRSTGINYNRNERMGRLFYWAYRQARDLEISEWTVDNAITFTSQNGTLVPASFGFRNVEKWSMRYKLRGSRDTTRHETFSNKEASLHLKTPAEATNITGRPLLDIAPHPHAVIYVESKRAAKMREALQNVPRTYRSF